MRALGLLVALFVVFAGCGGDDGSTQRAATDPATSSAAAEGAGLEGETLDGPRLSLADFRGTPVFVNVWASW